MPGEWRNGCSHWSRSDLFLLSSIRTFSHSSMRPIQLSTSMAESISAIKRAPKFSYSPNYVRRSESFVFGRSKLRNHHPRINYRMRRSCNFGALEADPPSLVPRILNHNLNIKSCLRRKLNNYSRPLIRELRMWPVLRKHNTQAKGNEIQTILYLHTIHILCSSHNAI